jgi:hypothetical protein
MTNTITRRSALAVALLAGGASSAAEPPTTPPEAVPAAAPAIEQEAVGALEKMGKYLRSLNTFAIQAETAKDEVLEDGRKLQFDRQLDIAVSRKDGLRVHARAALRNRNFYYDGSTFTLYSPDTHYYASFPAPATIREMLDAADIKFGITLPLADIFYWGTERAPVDDMQKAMVVGPGLVRGVECTHYAYSKPDVDWQLCIQPGDKPLPLKLVITTTAEPEQPQYAAVMQWELAPAFKEGAFTFVPPPEAAKISFQTQGESTQSRN